MTAQHPTDRPVSLLGLGTALPSHRLSQAEAISAAAQIFADQEQVFQPLLPVFDNAGISNRAFAMPLDWYLRTQNWQSRTDAYLAVAPSLFKAAALTALAEAGLRAEDVDAVITVSSSGIATPTLEAMVGDEMGLRADCQRIPVFGLGCAGGVAGLSLAARLAVATPGALVLMVAVELCSLAFRPDRATKSNIVASALFADGAAAAVLQVAPELGLIRLAPGVEHRWPNSLGIMGWKVDAQGFEVVFDRTIPPFVRRHLRAVLDHATSGFGLNLDTVTRRFHPGGAKVLDAINAAYGLPQEALSVEREVLAAHGNMSAPTALFVLQRALQRGMTGDVVLSALGPGFTAQALPLRLEG